MATKPKAKTITRNFSIMEASIKDEMCSYKYQIIDGIGLGDVHKVDGSGIIKHEMNKAFDLLDVHLAFIDDMFKHSGIEVDDIDKFHLHELSMLYSAKGIKIVGDSDNKKVSIKGTKFVSNGTQMNIETPFIYIDALSSYKWYNELRDAVEAVREQVSLYKEGNYYTNAEIDEKKGKKELKQTALTFEPEDADPDVPIPETKQPEKKIAPVKKMPVKKAATKKAATKKPAVKSKAPKKKPDETK